MAGPIGGSNALVRALVTSAGCLLPSVGALADGLPMPEDPEFQRVRSVHRLRADPDRHREAWEGFVRLSNLRPNVHDLQIWCTRTSFRLAHRRVQAGDREDGARIARAGIECALRYYEAVLHAKAPPGLEWETDDAREWARRRIRKVR